MATEVTMPKLGLTMTHGLLDRWLANEGDTVKFGQALFEIVTDKAAMEAQAPADGILHIVVANGTNVPVTGVIGYILAPGEQPVSGEGERAPTVEPKSNGQVIEAAAEASVPETRLASPAAKRRARELNVEIDQVPSSSSDGRISIADVERFAEATKTPEPPVQAAVAEKSAPSASVSPLARRLAQESGIDPATIRGTGEHGRVTREDVEKAIAAQRAAVPTTSTAAPDLVPISGVRTLIAQRMLASSQQTAPVTLTMDVDATELVKLRTQLNEGLKETLGFAISYSDILVKIAAHALKEFPYMNARQVGDAIRLLPDINVGVAVDTERGLLVPVIQNANRLTLIDIAKDSHIKIERAASGKSLPDDLGGGSFTITNLGALEVDAFTPIINPPEMAILGVGQIVEKPVAANGTVSVRHRVVLSLTFDHRWVDGAPAARFLRRIKQLVERPYLFLVEEQDQRKAANA